MLVAKDGTNVFSDESVEDAKSDPAARWIFNTSDGAAYQLLNASAKQNINVDAFDPKAGAAASDEEDGDLTDKIKVEGTVDANKVGDYKLVYSVTNSRGKTTTFTRTVHVQKQAVTPAADKNNGKINGKADNTKEDAEKSAAQSRQQAPTSPESPWLSWCSPLRRAC